ncbi:hypothetical protein F5148DRAFT_237621 [Russula earlei]|uniref:Uncharacterized protein n=1 Tax=Russula earlei TaxID=71964 RepID=A0ACC0U4C2_9AGAM|nr:hypothetical protein F5148DRAFT_237621 [Russula earlei]
MLEETYAGTNVGSLCNSELWWRDHYDDLHGRGYKLFLNTDHNQATTLPAMAHAVRIEDGRQVTLQKVFSQERPNELPIAQLFSSPGLKDNPKNHCIPLLDLVDLSHNANPDAGKFMVIPFLRPFDNPPFQTYGEFVAFFMQISEGLKFMHEQNVTNGDCTVNNIMFDPSGMYPDHPVRRDWRAKRYSRTERPPRYYFIDFGLSHQYSSRNVLEEQPRGDDMTSPPEHKRGGLCNPFRTDIYHLGSFVRDNFLKKYNGFEFMGDLVCAMTDENPARRPRIEDVIERFESICSSLSAVMLRSPITSKNDHTVCIVYRHLRQLTRTIAYVIHRRPAIPLPGGLRMQDIRLHSSPRVLYH